MEPKNLGFQFKQIHDSFKTDMDNKLKSQDLTMSQMGVLCCLFQNEGKDITHKDISEYLGLKHSTVIGILKRMEAKGFIISSINPSDHRSRNIYPTDKAYSIKISMDKHRNYVNDKLLQGLSDDEIEQLSVLLTKVYNNINQNIL